MHRNAFPLWSARILFVAVLCLSCCTGLTASETDAEKAEEQTFFSPTFFTDLQAAERAKDPVAELESLHEKSKTAAEQTEVELALGLIFNQRTGLVNPAEAIKWYDKALVKDLPATVLVKQLIYRGNMHEDLGHVEAALNDYVRGLLICLQYNLPTKWPSADATGRLTPPSMNYDFEPDNDATKARRLADLQRYQDYRRDYDTTKREQDLLRSRFYYVEAIKRVLANQKFVETDLREIAERLTNRQDRVDELLKRVREPNPSPFP